MGLFGNSSEKLCKAAAAADAKHVARYLSQGADANARNVYGRTPLTLAVSNATPKSERDVLTVVAALLARGADVDLADASGNTALVLASWRGLTKVVDALLAAKAAVDRANKDGNSALLWASIQGHAKIVAKLLAAGADVERVGPDGKTALHFAGSKGHTSIVRALLDAGADPDTVDHAGRTTFDQAEKLNQPLAARLLRDSSLNGSGLRGSSFSSSSSSSLSRLSSALSVSSLSDRTLFDTALATTSEPSAPPLETEMQLVSSALNNNDQELLAAARDGNVASVVASLRSGADVATTDEQGSTPLLVAAQGGHLPVVDQLLTIKAAVDATNGDGNTALICAASNGHVVVVLKLLAAGASVHSVNGFGETAVSVGLYNGHVEVLHELVDCDASVVTVLDANNRTLLHRAVASPHSSRVVDFVAGLSDVDVDAVDAAGVSALQLAVTREDEVAANVLLQRGALVDQKTILAASSPVTRALLFQHNYQLFNELCIALLNQPETATAVQISPLVPLITSVYDLRWLMTLLAVRESESGRADVLRAALDHILAIKLVFDTDACAFFKMMLESCTTSNWLPRLDVINYDRQAENINSESVAWVVELKRRVGKNTWRLDAHERCLKKVVDGVREVHAMVMENRNAVQFALSQVASVQAQVQAGRRLYAQLTRHTSEVVRQLHGRLEQCENNVVHVATSLQSFCIAFENRQLHEKRTKKLKLMCSVVASVAGFVLAPVIKEIADAVVDLTNPIEIVQTVFGEVDIAKFLANQSDKTMPREIESQLAAFQITSDEFEMLLREEIALQHPQFLEECDARNLEVDLDGGRGDTATALTPALQKEQAVVLEIVAELRIALSVVNPTALQRIDSQADDWRSFDQVDDDVTEQPVGGDADTDADQNALPGSQRDVVMFVDDAAAFPYHAAVHDCGGDLATFLTRVENLPPTENDASSLMQMRICTVATYREALCAAQYAYCLGHREVGDLLAARMDTPPAGFTTTALSVTLVEDADHVPYFEIIQESQGDATLCEHYLDLIDTSECALATAIVADAVRVRQSSALAWSVAQYASHLGFVDVVKQLLKTLGKQVPIKERLRLVNHALEQAQAQLPQRTAHGA